MDTEGGWRVQCALIGVTLFVFGIGVWATAPEPANPVDDAPEPRVAPLSFEAGLDAQKQRIESARTVAGHSRWDGTYRDGNGYDSRELLFAHGQGFVYHAGTCVGSYASFGDISDGADGLRLTRRQQSAALAGLAEPKALLPVPWGRRRYLVPENRLGDFALAIHAGVEPRCGHWGRFLLRGGDERRVVSGLPELPAAWQGLLRRKALVLHVSARGRRRSRRRRFTAPALHPDARRRRGPRLAGRRQPAAAATAHRVLGQRVGRRGARARGDRAVRALDIAHGVRQRIRSAAAVGRQPSDRRRSRRPGARRRVHDRRRAGRHRRAALPRSVAGRRRPGEAFSRPAAALRRCSSPNSR